MMSISLVQPQRRSFLSIGAIAIMKHHNSTPAAPLHSMSHIYNTTGKKIDTVAHNVNTYNYISKYICSNSVVSSAARDVHNVIDGGRFTPFLTQYRYHSDEETGDRHRPIQMTWVHPDGRRQETTCYHGQNLLEVAMEHDLPIEGACAGSCACSTCHVYISKQEDYDTFPEPSDEENDMLDLAFFPQPSSRLGCQVSLDAAVHEGLVVELPKATRNMAVDGYVSKPH